MGRPQEKSRSITLSVKERLTSKQEEKHETKSVYLPLTVFPWVTVKWEE